MRVQLSWLAELVPQIAGLDAQEVANLFDGAGIEVDAISGMGPKDIDGLRIGEVIEIEELTEFKKPIRYCQVRFDDGSDPAQTRGIVCGAANFKVGDRIVAALPGAVLPGDFHIAARKTYGRVSDGMICSTRELGIGDDHDGILVLPEDAPIGADAVQYLGLHDVVLVTEPTPDRGYQLSMRGIAREAASALRVPFTDFVAEIPPPPTGEGFPVEIQDPACDGFATRVIRGFDHTAASPEWMRRKLTACGMRPISLAVDVTNYVMMLTGQSMHAYDLDRLTGKIIVRKATEGEIMMTLDDVKRTLSADDLLVTDEAGIHGLAGVMGGALAEIGDETQNILLEAAHWDPATVSRSARRHGLLTEAGKRFERGVDPLIATRAIELATQLLTEYGGGTPDPFVSAVGEPHLLPPVEVAPQRVRELIGVDYPTERIVECLEAVGCTVTGTGPFVVTPPSWRTNLVDVADFAEEVARIDGYDNIPSILPQARAGGGLTSKQRLRRAASRALAASGLVETPSMSFQDDAVLDRLGLEADDERRNSVRIANPIAADQRTLRTTLLPGLLGVIRRNTSRGFDDLGVFEFGTVFFESADPVHAPQIDVAVHPADDQFVALEAARPTERLHAAIALCGATSSKTWWADRTEAGWRDAIDAVRRLADSVRADVVIEQASIAPWHPGRCAAIKLADGQVIGYAGELHPQACEDLGVPARTAVAEVDLGALIDAGRTDADAPNVSPFPRAVQDLALVVDDTIPVAALAATIRNAGGELLEDAPLFDVYTGAQVGAGKRSLAFAISMRAADRTLTSEEINGVRQSIIEAVQREHDAVLR